MNKKCLLVLAFIIMLSLSGYAQSDSGAQSESKGNFFFSIGLSHSIFSGGPIIPFSNFEIKMLTPGMIGGYYELPSGPGYTFFGLEAGYSSGSRFGGSGGVDFIPIDFTAAYVFPLANILYIGPRLKIGALGLLGPDWNKALLTAGARLDAELQFYGFPFGLFVAGGIDVFPTTAEFATLPAIEAGLRFPRGKNKKSGTTGTKGKEPAKTDTGGSKDDSSGNIAVVPAPAAATAVATTSAPTTSAPATAAPAPVATVPATVAPATETRAPAATGPAPATTAPVTAIAAPVVTSSGAATPVASAANATQGQNRSIILEDGRQGILNSIYFEPDTAVLIESYRPVLESVGRQLAADPGLKLLIRAYAADFGTANGRYMVSVNRAKFSRDFLTAQYGVSANRFINIEAFGSDKSPIYATTDWQSYRCVELILLRD